MLETGRYSGAVLFSRGAAAELDGEPDIGEDGYPSDELEPCAD